MNIETFLLLKFCGGSFYPRFRKLLNEAKINTNNSNNKRNTSAAIKSAVAIWAEAEKIMADVKAGSRKI